MKMYPNSDDYQSWFEPAAQCCDDREPGGYNLCSQMRRASRDPAMVAAELARMGIGEEGDEPEVMP